ncbi:MAG TPA: hypothetical protein VH186_38055 [Chloroflexia bacterium]|nr:hypothetical protein [Chloroflexia bacterium]
MLSRLLSGLPYYLIIGWVGFVATLGMMGSLFVDWAVIIGWITIVTTTILFYTTTIEAPYVECEWASFITIPAGLIMMLAGVEPVNYFVAIAGPLALLYGAAELFAPRLPWLNRLLQADRRRARAKRRREEALIKLRQEWLLEVVSDEAA